MSSSAVGNDGLGIDLNATPALSKGFRLQWEPAQNAHVLLYPEGMIKLNPSATAILGRCDGSHSIAEIVDELELLFARRGLANEVKTFVAVALDNGWLRAQP